MVLNIGHVQFLCWEEPHHSPPATQGALFPSTFSPPHPHSLQEHVTCWTLLFQISMRQNMIPSQSPQWASKGCRLCLSSLGQPIVAALCSATIYLQADQVHLQSMCVHKAFSRSLPKVCSINTSGFPLFRGSALKCLFRHFCVWLFSSRRTNPREFAHTIWTCVCSL